MEEEKAHAEAKPREQHAKQPPAPAAHPEMQRKGVSKTYHAALLGRLLQVVHRSPLGRVAGLVHNALVLLGVEGLALHPLNVLAHFLLAPQPLAVRLRALRVAHKLALLRLNKSERGQRQNAKQAGRVSSTT